MKFCCFLGHRKIHQDDALKAKLKDTIEKLIISGVYGFIFGSKSEFDDLCWDIVTELKNKYPMIIRIGYRCPNEFMFTNKSEKEKIENIYFKLTNEEVFFKYYEEIYISDNIINSRKNSYITRNQEMIDNSDVCVFYFNTNYLNDRTIKNIYKSKSGTDIAYNYALKKKKSIINLYE